MLDSIEFVTLEIIVALYLQHRQGYSAEEHSSAVPASKLHPPVKPHQPRLYTAPTHQKQREPTLPSQQHSGPSQSSSPSQHPVSSKYNVSSPLLDSSQQTASSQPTTPSQPFGSSQQVSAQVHHHDTVTTSHQQQDLASTHQQVPTSSHQPAHSHRRESSAPATSNPSPRGSMHQWDSIPMHQKDLPKRPAAPSPPSHLPIQGGVHPHPSPLHAQSPRTPASETSL